MMHITIMCLVGINFRKCITPKEGNNDDEK